MRVINPPAWLQKPPQIARSLQQISKVVLVVTACMIVLQIPGATAEFSRDCIHKCKADLFKGANNIFSNGVCAILCAGVRYTRAY